MGGIVQRYYQYVGPSSRSDSLILGLGIFTRSSSLNPDFVTAPLLKYCVQFPTAGHGGGDHPSPRISEGAKLKERTRLPV